MLVDGAAAARRGTVNDYSWEGLFKSSRKIADVVWFKFVLMGRFLVFVGPIGCSGKDTDIVSFLMETRMAVKRYVYWKWIKCFW